MNSIDGRERHLRMHGLGLAPRMSAVGSATGAAAKVATTGRKVSASS
jgi:hypothetical protein